MIFSATNPFDQFPKNMDMQSSCKNDSMSSSCMNGAAEKPRMKLPPAHNKEKKPCKVIKERADGKLVLTSSSSMNGVEKKPSLVLGIKLPQTAHNKEKLSCTAKVPTTSSDIDMKNGCLNSCSKNPISRCPTKLASKGSTKHKSDKQQIPTSSNGTNCAEMKACKVMKSAMDNKLVLMMPSSGMSGSNSGGKKERRVMSAPHQNKTAVQQTGSTNGSSALAKAADKSCLEKLQMDEALLELKLEAYKRKLHQRYQRPQNGKRKIQLIDFKDIPKPENVAKRPKRQYRW